ncbi:MAG: hypothetical protein A07HR60_02796 [uncultured archaeon A07HR60]|nr:MAG: hypothetical protein A07HR60_02796 [uncultured archaeon A07HR60]
MRSNKRAPWSRRKGLICVNGFDFIETAGPVSGRKGGPAQLFRRVEDPAVSTRQLALTILITSPSSSWYSSDTCLSERASTA